jgi:hypothetical protein
MVGVDEDAEATLLDLLIERNGRMNGAGLLSATDLTGGSMFRVWSSARPGGMKL